MTEKQKMLAGELYSPLDSELVKLREFARKRIETFKRVIFFNYTTMARVDYIHC